MPDLILILTALTVASLGLVGVALLWEKFDRSTAAQSDSFNKKKSIGCIMKKSSEEEVKVTLELLAKKMSWDGKKGEPISMSTLATQWADHPNNTIQQKSLRSYQHPEINQFYREQIIGRSYFTDTILEVAETLLDFLDKNGDCSSITTGNKHENEDTSFPSNTIGILSAIPLWKHTLNVAYEVIHDTKDKPELTFKGIIAALAHDIGKVPKIYKEFCVQGPHQTSSLTVLSQMEIVKSLGFAKDLREAIQMHHSKKTANNTLLCILIDADQEARRKEASAHLKEMIVPIPTEISEPDLAANVREPEPIAPLSDPIVFKPPPACDPPPGAEEPPVVIAPAITDPAPLPAAVTNQKKTLSKKKAKPEVSSQAAPNQPDEDPFRTPPSSVGLDLGEFAYPKKEIPVPWLDPPTFLALIGNHINSRVTGGNRYWSGLSKDGLVYFRKSDFRIMLQLYVKGTPVENDVCVQFLANQNAENLIYSVVKVLERHGAVAGGYLEKGNSTGRFALRMKGQSFDPSKVLYLIPFYSNFFPQQMINISRDTPSNQIESILKVAWVPRHDPGEDTAASYE